MTFARGYSWIPPSDAASFECPQCEHTMVARFPGDDQPIDFTCPDCGWVGQVTAHFDIETTFTFKEARHDQSGASG